MKPRWRIRQGCAFVQDLMCDGQIAATIWHIGPARWRVFVRQTERRALAEVGSEQNQRAAKASAMRELGHA